MNVVISLQIISIAIVFVKYVQFRIRTWDGVMVVTML